MPLIDERRTTKERHERYRDAVKRLYPGVVVRDNVSVNEDVEKIGALIEVVVWIPCSEIAPQLPSIAHLVPQVAPDVRAKQIKAGCRCEIYQTCSICRMSD